MREEIDQLVVAVTLVDRTAPDGNGECAKEERNVECVEPEATVPHHDLDSSTERSAFGRVTFVEAGVDRAGGVETEGFASEPGREDEGD